MQNFLTDRYRRVHDKIKDVRISDLTNKFPKGIREIRILSFLDHFPPVTLMDKVNVVGMKIMRFSYANYWRKSLPLKYWTVGLIISLPLFYQVQAMTNTNTNAGNLGIVSGNVVDAKGEGDGAVVKESAAQDSK